jgi:hypothetical protein
MNWEWILSVIGIVLFCVAFYAYLSEPVGKAFDDADDAGYIVRRQALYTRSEPIPMMEPMMYGYPYDGLPEENKPETCTDSYSEFPEIVDALLASPSPYMAPPTPSKKPRKAANKAVKKVAKKTEKKKPNSTR